MLQKSGHWDRMLLDCTENLYIYDNIAEISSALNLLLQMVLRRYIWIDRCGQMLCERAQ